MQEHLSVQNLWMRFACGVSIWVESRRVNLFYHLTFKMPAIRGPAIRRGERGDMRSTITATAHTAGQIARVGWYFGLSRLLSRRASSLGHATTYRPSRPVPSRDELFSDLFALLQSDADNVRAGRYPSLPEGALTPAEFLARIRAMFADLPASVARRASEDAASARATPGADDPDLPDYFRQDFHFQSGGYLTDDSARLYDVQVETLFMGTAGPMRRACLGPVLDAIAGRDQRRLALLDVACGTGRFLRQVRLVRPALELTGLDLSGPYLREAERSFDGLRPARWLKANAERMPVPDASQDVVTSVYLFHELPPDARRNAAREFARVLKPGGTLVFMDSLQMGDKPGYDGMLEAFPIRFHEPYFRHYAIDDLAAIFRDVGLTPVETRPVFLSKLVVCRKQ